MGLDSPSHHCSTHLFTLYSRFACSKLVISTSSSLLRSYSHFVRERLPWQIIYWKCLTYSIACPHILDMSHNTLSRYYQRCWPVFTQDSTLCLSVSFYISIRLIMGIFLRRRSSTTPPIPRAIHSLQEPTPPSYVQYLRILRFSRIDHAARLGRSLSRMLTNISNCPTLLSIVRGIGHYFF